MRGGMEMIGNRNHTDSDRKGEERVFFLTAPFPQKGIEFKIRANTKA